MVEICAVKFPNIEWLKIVVAIGKTSYYNESFFEILKKVKDEDIEPFFIKLIDMGHESVLEHITFTFDVFDISRWAANQLVRHRIASYTQKSLRKIRPVTVDEFVVDKDFPEKLRPALIKYYAMVVKFYTDLVERGVSPDDARAVLPGSIKTEVVWTINLRGLRNFLKQRKMPEASPEMRELSNKIISIFEELDMLYLLKGIVDGDKHE